MSVNGPDLIGSILRGALMGTPAGPIVSALGALTTKSDDGATKPAPANDATVLALIAALTSRHDVKPVQVHWAVPLITFLWAAMFMGALVLRMILKLDDKAVGVSDFSLGFLATGAIMTLCYWVSSTFASYSKSAWARDQAPIVAPPVPAPVPDIGGGVGLPPPAPEEPKEPVTDPEGGSPTAEPEKLISDAARDMIVGFEVTSRDNYERALQRPTWPKAGSGVTIGIGYDVGAGVSSKDKLWDDWRGKIPDSMIKALEPCVGVTGSAANALLPQVQNVVVPWDAAVDVYTSTTIPEEYARCKRYLPNFDDLSPDSRGALVSLVMNRGPSFNKDGDRYQEMRAIKQHMAAKDFDMIPDEIRSMKRIWEGQGLDGLLKRRDKEAAMFELGLRSDGDDEPSKDVATGADLIRLAETYVGGRYVLGIVVPKDQASYPKDKGMDCAEFVSYVIAQVTGRLYGCTNDNAPMSVADAYSGSFWDDVNSKGIAISVEEAARIPGAFLVRRAASGNYGHVAFSLGDGRTVEAKSTNEGIVIDKVSGRRWDTGGKVPWVSYGGNAPVDVTPPNKIYRAGQPNMSTAVIKEIQSALEKAGYSSGGIDGVFGKNTEKAVVRFQIARGLVPDGEVGEQTAKALGVEL